MLGWIERVATGVVSAVALACIDDPRVVELAPEPSGCAQLSEVCYRGYTIETGSPEPWHDRLAAVDIDGDGHLDLVSFGEPLSYAPGRGDGTFGYRERHLLGAAGGAVVGDLDGDGRPDVVTGRLDVIFGGDAPALPAPIDARSFHSPRRLARGRWLGDGRSAIAVCDRAGDLAVLEELGDGHFAERFRVELGDPVDAAAIELDASPGQAVGLVVADVEGSIWLLSPGQSGALSPDGRRVIATGDRPRALATGDLDGDGRDELVVAFEGEPKLRIYGQVEPAVPATFEQLAELQLATGSRDVALADLDADGALDLLALASESFTLELRRGLGGVQFEPPEHVLIGSRPRVLEIADVDGDGALDVAVLTSLGQVAVRRGDGQGGLGELQLTAGLSDPWYEPRQATSLAALDLLPSGGRELVVGHDRLPSGDDTPDTLHVYAWLDGGLQKIQEAAVDMWIADLLVSDLDGVTGDDLLVLSRDLGVVVPLYSRGLGHTGTFRGFAHARPLLHREDERDVALLDLDGDGDLDVVGGGGQPAVIENLGGRRFAVRSEGHVGTCEGAVLAGDFDEDGQDDAALIDCCTTTVDVYLGDGAGGLAPIPISTTVPDEGSYCVGWRLDLGDVDGDGRLDIVMALVNHHAIQMLLGRGDGGFHVINLAVTYEPGDLDLADADLDGTDELWIQSQDELFVRVAKLADRRELFGVLELPLADRGHAHNVADFNEDGYPDYVTYDYSFSSQSGWLRGWISAP